MATEETRPKKKPQCKECGRFLSNDVAALRGEVERLTKERECLEAERDNVKAELAKVRMDRDLHIRTINEQNVCIERRNKTIESLKAERDKAVERKREVLAQFDEVKQRQKETEVNLAELQAQLNGVTDVKQIIADLDGARKYNRWLLDDRSLWQRIRNVR